MPLIEKLKAMEIIDLILQSRQTEQEYGPICDVECKNCGQILKKETLKIRDRLLAPSDLVCSECIRKADEDETEQRWKFVCPMLFLDNDVSKIRKDIIDVCQAWITTFCNKIRFGQIYAAGIGLIGPNRIGKTRAMWFMRKKLFQLGLKTEFITMVDLANLFMERFGGDGNADSALWKINRLKNTAVLFLDDMGKEKLTERVQVDFLDLVDTRMRECRPIIWSGNKSGQDMHTSASTDSDAADRSRAVLLRLAECCETRNFHEKK